MSLLCRCWYWLTAVVVRMLPFVDDLRDEESMGVLLGLVEHTAPGACVNDALRELGRLCALPDAVEVDSNVQQGLCCACNMSLGLNVFRTADRRWVCKPCHRWMAERRRRAGIPGPAPRMPEFRTWRRR